MDSLELNKVLGAVLGTCLFALGTGFLAELIYHPKPAGNAGYPLPGGGGEGGQGGGDSAKKEEKKEDGIAALLASADAEKGKGASKACAACHSFDKGGPNKIGPGLWEVVERKKGGHEGFDYSAGLKEKGGTWTYEDLNAFLTKPSEYIKGTKMAFGGIGSPQERANVIAYLRTLSESPKPLPEAKKDEAQKDDKAAEGGKDGAKKPEEGKKAEGDKKAEGGGDPIVAKVASADPAKGKDGTKPCQACHSFEKGGPNKVGPDLWGVVGRKKGGHEGFDYSAGLKEKGGEWTIADLDKFLTKPAEYVKGTKMAFQGIPQEDKRAEVIAYLRTLADNPQPLPGAEKKEDAKAADKKAEGEQKPDQAKPAETKPAEKKAEDGKPADKAESNPEGEKKPEDPKSAEKPAEAKPDQKAAEGQPDGEKKPEEGKPAEAKPEDKKAEAKPDGEKKPDQGKEQAKPDEKAEGEKKADDANAGAQPSAEKPAEEKPKE